MRKWIGFALIALLAGCARQPLVLPEGNQDVTAAAAQARETGRMLLLNFSGSDWCKWCVTLDHEILSQPAFQAYAEQNLVSVVLDFPRRTPQDPAVREQNERLLRHFGVRGFPTLLLFSPDGELMGRLGYEPGGPAALIRTIEQHRERHLQRPPGQPPAEKLPA
jgi:thioredoxin-related protein